MDATYMGIKGERDGARADGVKVALECKALQSELDAITRERSVLRENFNSACEQIVKLEAEQEYRQWQVSEAEQAASRSRKWGIKKRRERDKLQAVIDDNKIAMWRAERNAEELQTQVDKPQAELDVRDEQVCAACCA